MKRIVLGIVIGMALSAAPVLALRTERPQAIVEWTPNSFAQLNNILLQLWNISNGRYQSDSISTNPNGARNCTKGEILGANFGGSDRLCQCTTTGNTWKCVVIS